MNDIKYVKDLDEAYKLGYFSSSLTRDELFDIISKNNEDLKYIYGQNAIGLYDTKKSKYISPIGRVNPIPKFTLMQKDSNKVLVKSYRRILQSIRRQGYEIDY